MGGLILEFSLGLLGLAGVLFVIRKFLIMEESAAASLPDQRCCQSSYRWQIEQPQWQSRHTTEEWKCSCQT